ncbi:P-loop containing nucleoside triphosphate hydrolase protein [Phialemonium atrogriseum]|uniref:P-loop containing nucleoside triphosphate hydrolase protein n=1 Tax=Phialemonium atrogriseum TaxID=1093897 RepID=A0AAJ0FIT0_9PEZI|nr:P-loop containing nucleoside triphosphate hydrolase protein [Phialemonium atrogriseum]KAK1769167.1 P-loop containing nucleoside triphosphate hydrolase protein [Phialemonium atrogriseum]
MLPPVFAASHPRACSTAFERVFMTRRDTLSCVHEPFGDPFYYGPERLSSRFEDDAALREATGYSKTTYKDVMDQIDAHSNEGKRVFIKDIAYYLFPENGAPAKPAPSLLQVDAKGSAKPGTLEVNGTGGVNGVHAANGVNGVNGVNGANGINGTNGTNGADKPVNPTVVPTELLQKFHFTFLIRHPRRSIPSYFKCTIPPLDEVTKFYHFMPSEAGYDELRRLFDYLKDEGIIGRNVPITVIDADDLLDKPAEVIEAYCKQVGIDYTPDMLRWEDEENQQYAVQTFEKWNGFHNDVISSTYLKPRSHAVV